MRLVVRALVARLHVGLLRGVHRLLLIALRRWRVLALLLRLRVRLPGALLREGLAVRAVELRIRRRILPAPNRVRGHECLRLRGDGREDTFLREALAIGTAAILRLVEAGAANLMRASGRARDPPEGGAYLAPATITARDGGALARGGLRWGVGHLRLLVRRRVHLRGRGQRAILVGVLRLEGLHCGTLRHGLGDGRDLGWGAGVSSVSGESGVDGAHDGFNVDGDADAQPGTRGAESGGE